MLNRNKTFEEKYKEAKKAMEINRFEERYKTVANLGAEILKAELLAFLDLDENEEVKEQFMDYVLEDLSRCDD